jgi:hypothetical protein
MAFLQKTSIDDNGTCRAGFLGAHSDTAGNPAAAGFSAVSSC